MNLLPPLLAVFFGYIFGWALRYTITYFRKPVGACNIGKRGSLGRTILAIICIIFGFYTGSLWLFAVAGFTLYESRAKWCIARAMMK